MSYNYPDSVRDKERYQNNIIVSRNQFELFLQNGEPLKHLHIMCTMNSQQKALIPLLEYYISIMLFHQMTHEMPNVYAMESYFSIGVCIWVESSSLSCRIRM